MHSILRWSDEESEEDMMLEVEHHHLYDALADSDMKEIWDSPLELQLGDENMKGADCDWVCSDVGGGGGVILNDRMMTDAALNNGAPPPVKREHSYSIAMPSRQTPRPQQQPQHYSKDMESECFPAIPMSSATGGEGASSGLVTPVVVKEEPRSAPTSPEPAQIAPQMKNDVEIKPDPDYEPQQTVMKQPTIVFTTRPGQTARLFVPKLNIKIEPGASTGYSLPPTPPSSTGSDSEGSLSPMDAGGGTTTTTGNLHLSRGPTKVLLTCPSRQPINTPLISTQPKNGTGILFLTEEEKRTLLAEGYPVPTKLPLSKSEERNLKKIRRKIKNKISAQESRRKKKEYMDSLERKVQCLENSNDDFRKKVEMLEATNAALLQEVERLQERANNSTHLRISSSHKDEETRSSIIKLKKDKIAAVL